MRKIPIFLSYPKPCFQTQEDFVHRVKHYLEHRGISPGTLGVTEYDVDAPLKGIRRLMIESNGLITLAFRRTFIKEGTVNLGSDVEDRKPQPIADSWLTTPWAHIEPAMAYQLGLPILIFREKGVLADGLLERGVVGVYMPEFDLSQPMDGYFSSAEWNGLMGKWEGYVRAVVERKGNPPQLY